MDLFDVAVQHSSLGRPLADLLRPESLEQFVGQTKALKPLIPLVKSGELPSLILWGPPGTGKTTLALILAKALKGTFVSRNAVDTGAKILRELGVEAHQRRVSYREKTILFIDEIHRLNKSQQDVILPNIETGDFILIGATTENPSYELNPALLSRCRLVVFEPLAESDLQELVTRGFARMNVNPGTVLVPETQAAIVSMASGDARKLLNAVEHICNLYLAEPASAIWPLTPQNLDQAWGGQALYYDKDRDQHHDTISAFIKSIRGSDADAGLYYLARMLKAGEDPLFIARRLVILASEDVGNADPRALSVAVAGAQATELVGLPEAAINLAQVVTYLSSAPKSNRSYLGLRKAEAEVSTSGQLPIPLSLRSSRKSEMRTQGYGADYKYSHEGDRGWIEQTFLPERISNQKFYEPSDHGFEKNIRQYLTWLKQKHDPDP